MSISLSASNSRNPVVNESSHGEDLDASTNSISRSAVIAIEAGRIAKEIIDSSSSFARFFQERTPPIVMDEGIYSNKKLALYAKIDQTETYRYVMKEFAIYGTTTQECEEVYRLYQNLGKTEQGRLIQKLMQEDIKKEKLFLFGHPKTRIVNRLGLFVQATSGGNVLSSAILIPLNKPQIAREIHWSHEAGHYLVNCLTPDGSICPISNLPLSVQTDFMNKYHAIRARFLENPHSLGTSNWRVHEFLKAHFEKIFKTYSGICYPPDKHATEIAAFTLELELALPGFLKKYGAGDLGEALHDILYHQRSLPKRILDHLPLQKKIPENTHTVSLSNLNNSERLSTGLGVFKSVGNGIKKALKVANHPLAGLPIEICFNYKSGEEKALLNAIKDGTAVWSIGTTMNLMMLAALGAPFTITYSIIAVAAEIIPDFNEMADSLPNVMEVLDSPDCKKLTMLEKIVLQEQIIEAKMNLKLLGILQDGFKALNPQRIWEKVKTKLARKSQKNSTIEEASEQLENFVIKELSPYLNSNNNLGSFFNNPAALLPVPELTFASDAAGIPQPDFKNCKLQWQVKKHEGKELSTIETSLEIPKNGLESLGELTTAVETAFPGVLDLEIVENTNAGTSHLHLDSLTKEETMPSFGSLSKVTDIQMGVGVGGGIGLILSLASGAKVSLAVTEMSLVTGISVPLGSGFLTALGTGLAYAAPITAVLISVPFMIRAHKKQIINRLNKDNKNAIQEVEKVQDSLTMCVDFFEKFNKGEINKEEFLAKVNQTSRLLTQSGYNMGKRGKFFENHQGSSFEYFSQKTRLEQIDLDLRAMAHDALVKHNVDGVYAHGIKEKSLDLLYSDLLTLAGKKVISMHEKFQQEALKSEICTRIQNEGDLDALSKVEMLTQKAAAISLEPPSIAKPNKIRVKNVRGKSDESSRLARKKTEGWAERLVWTYSRFCEEARNYNNIEDLEKAANRVKEQIVRVDGKHDIHLTDYEIKGTYSTAWDYYNDFIKNIEKNVEISLNKARAVENGEAPEEVRPLFSTEEMAILHFKTALRTFDQASACLHDESQEIEQKNSAFDEMMKAAKVITGLSYLSEKPEELKEVIDPVLKIGSQYTSYESYISTMNRLETIKTHIEGLHAINQQEDDLERKKSNEDVKKELEVAYGYAKHLVELGVSKEDIEKLTGKPEDAEKMKEEIIGYAKAICDVYTVKKYESKMPDIYAPAARLLIHILGDFHRFDGYENLKLPVAVLSATHSFAPDLLPTGLALPVAYWKGDGQVMTGAFLEKVKKVCSNSINAVSHPLGTLESAKGLHKKSNLLQSANVTVQIMASVITASAEKVFGESLTVKGMNRRIHFTAFCVNGVSNVVYYANFSTKFYKYCSAGTFGLKMHKIGPGLGGIVSSVFDLYEFMATDLELSRNQAELGYSDRFKKEIKERLPNFNGSLPESSLYYGGRDCFLTAAYGFMGANPITVGLAVYQGGASAYSYLSGKYEDDALCAIMLNHRYNSKQPQTEKVKQSLRRSVKSLEYYLQSKFTISVSDSKIKKRARAFYFEHHLNTFEREGNIKKVIKLTTLRFNSMSCIYLRANIEVFDAIDIVFKRFNAFLIHSSVDARYCIENFDERVQELTKVKEYFTQKFDTMPRNERERNNENCLLILENIERISFVHKIIYLEKTEDLKGILEETELVWDATLTSCAFKTTGIEVVDCLDLFFKRCKALHKQVCDDPFKGRDYIFQALAEIEKVADYLDKKAEALNDPNYFKDIRKELKLNVMTTFLSCYCLYYIKKNFEDSASPWEAFQMFDKIPKTARNVLHWYTLGCILEKIADSCERESDLLGMELENISNELIFDLSSLQRSCFTIILTMLKAKEEARQELSEFDVQLYKNSAQILENLNRKLPSESNFSQIRADTEIKFHDLLQDLLKLKNPETKAQ